MTNSRNDYISETEIQKKIEKNILLIAGIVAKDHNCEIRKDRKAGIKILDVVRKPVSQN